MQRSRPDGTPGDPHSVFTSILAKPALSGYGASSSDSNLCYELNPGGTCRPPVDLLSLGVPPRQKKEGGKGNGGGVRRGEEGREGEGRASARLLGGRQDPRAWVDNSG